MDSVMDALHPIVVNVSTAKTCDVSVGLAVRKKDACRGNAQDM